VAADYLDVVGRQLDSHLPPLRLAARCIAGTANFTDTEQLLKHTVLQCDCENGVLVTLHILDLMAWDRDP
jgi:hypothetical protein